MKEHFQDYGIRKWAGNDLIELQSEPLEALQKLVEPYAPCILQGCGVTENEGDTITIAPGLVALQGKDYKGEDCVKIARFAGIADKEPPVYLTLECEPDKRVYGDSKSKAIAYHYRAVATTKKPEAPYLVINASDNKRLVDTLGITQKLDREGDNASDVKVMSFTTDNAEKPTPIAPGMTLKELFGRIHRWLSELKAMAFKAQVAKSDLAFDLDDELGKKVDKDGTKGLSDQNFTEGEKEKLKNIADNANNYTHPSSVLWTKGSGLYKIAVNKNGHVTSATLVTKDDITALGIPGQDTDTVYTHPASAAGAKKEGLYKITTDANGHITAVTDVTKTDITNLGIPAQDTQYTHPTTASNKHIPAGGSSGQYLKYGGSSGTATWASPASNLATTSAAGFMSADDKNKLKNCLNIYYIGYINADGTHEKIAGSIDIKTSKIASGYHVSGMGTEAKGTFIITNTTENSVTIEVNRIISNGTAYIKVKDTSGNVKYSPVMFMVIGN